MAMSTMTRPSVRAGSTKRDSRRTSSREPRGPKRWVRLSITLLVVALLVTGVWVLGFSSVFETREVTVSKTSVVTAAEVRTAAAVPLGLPLARQDLEAVAQRIAALRPVESVQVERRWPNTVAIEIVERRPAIAVKQSVGFELVDRFGIAYDSVDRAPDDLAVASVDLTNGPVLVAAADVAAELPQDLRSKLTSIKATTLNDLTLTFGGTTVTWGTKDQTGLKAQVVQALLDRKGSDKQIDVSAPHNPSVR